MTSDTREPVLRIGLFDAVQQDVIDADFRCVCEAEIAADGALRGAVRAIVTRSNYQVRAEVIDRLPALRVIATSGVGYDGIPVAHAAKRGIVVTNTPGVLDAAVCELGIGLLLALLRQIPAADRHVRGGAWREHNFPLTTSLAGKRVGIVGLGRIGMGIAQRLTPFGVDLAYTGTQRASLPYRYCESPRARRVGRHPDPHLPRDRAESPPGRRRDTGCAGAERLPAQYGARQRGRRGRTWRGPEDRHHPGRGARCVRVRAAGRFAAERAAERVALSARGFGHAGNARGDAGVDAG